MNDVYEKVNGFRKETTLLELGRHIYVVESVRALRA